LGSNKHLSYLEDFTGFPTNLIFLILLAIKVAYHRNEYKVIQKNQTRFSRLLRDLKNHGEVVFDIVVFSGCSCGFKSADFFGGRQDLQQLFGRFLRLKSVLIEASISTSHFTRKHSKFALDDRLTLKEQKRF
jgi:hypothetical protein